MNPSMIEAFSALPKKRSNLDGYQQIVEVIPVGYDSAQWQIRNAL